MKGLILIVCSAIMFSGVVFAQNQIPRLLMQPAGWQFERFSLPPEFAPRIPHKGVEELRFSPGMFSKDSATYFAYAFVATLDNINSISQDALKSNLLRGGSCIAGYRIINTELR